MAHLPSCHHHANLSLTRRIHILPPYSDDLQVPCWSRPTHAPLYFYHCQLAIEFTLSSLRRYHWHACVKSPSDVAHTTSPAFQQPLFVSCVTNVRLGPSYSNCTSPSSCSSGFFRKPYAILTAAGALHRPLCLGQRDLTAASDQPPIVPSATIA